MIYVLSDLLLQLKLRYSLKESTTKASPLEWMHLHMKTCINFVIISALGLRVRGRQDTLA